MGTAEIALNGVGSSEVLDDSLSAFDLAPDSVGSSEIAGGSVGTSELNSSEELVGASANWTNNINPVGGDQTPGDEELYTMEVDASTTAETASAIGANDTDNDHDFRAVAYCLVSSGAHRRLNKKGKAKVTYTPDGGDPSTESKKVKLKKRR